MMKVIIFDPQVPHTRLCLSPNKLGIPAILQTWMPWQDPKRLEQGTVSSHLPISDTKLADFNLVISDVSNKDLRVHFERQMGFKLTQQAPTRLCSMRRQNRTAFPTSRKFWKQTVFNSAYSTMSFNWWWKNSKMPEIKRSKKITSQEPEQILVMIIQAQLLPWKSRQKILVIWNRVIRIRTNFSFCLKSTPIF